MAVESAQLLENELYLTPVRQPHQHFICQFFTGQMLFLMPIRQCGSTEGSIFWLCSENKTVNVLQYLK